MVTPAPGTESGQHEVVSTTSLKKGVGGGGVGRKRQKGNSRIFEFADPTEFLTLYTAGIVRVTFDLLFPACYTGDRQSLARFASFGHTPVGVHHFSINDRLAMRPVVIEIAHTLARHFRRTHKSRQEVRPRPNLWAQAVFGGDSLAREGTWRPLVRIRDALLLWRRVLVYSKV